MTPLQTGILVTYFFVLSILGMYGWHRYYLIREYRRNKHRAPGPPPPMPDPPVVTVQLPIFNEMYVVDRLIDAVSDLEYPRDRLEIQVLDDSTDETRQIAELAVRRLAQRGFDVHYLHRTDRIGYKAGALDAGMTAARGEFIAIFDADFIPQPDFLLKTVPYFMASDRLALVQARWGHLNADYSLLTRVQSILLDGHFVLEHGGRNRAGLFFNFNGTAGVWRRTAIADAGGWQHDTLTEDLDLSYRAQFRGWQFLFLPDVVAPAEVPVEMNAFKKQQHRWAKGSIQTCMKVLPLILDSDLPLRVKAEAFFHLTANFNYLLMIVMSALIAPAMYVRASMGYTEMLLIDVPAFFAATASVVYFYSTCQREIYRDWRSRWKYLPAVLAIGIGLAVNNAKAVLEALFGYQTEFARTPKYGIERMQDDWQHKKYRQSMHIQPLVELSLGLYFTATIIYAVDNGIFGTVPFLMLFQFGFLYTGVTSLVQQFTGEQVLVKATGKIGV